MIYFTLYEFLIINSFSLKINLVLPRSHDVILIHGCEEILQNLSQFPIVTLL